MAGVLLAHAAAAAVGPVRLVYAHTVLRENASTRILRRLGFRLAGAARDDEVGAVWQWERSAGAPAD